MWVCVRLKCIKGVVHETRSILTESLVLMAYTWYV